MMKGLYLLALPMLLLASCGGKPTPTPEGEIVDALGKKFSPKDYSRICCVGAGALRMYSYVGDLEKLCAVEDIDDPTDRASETGPKQFSGVPRPYFDLNTDVFNNLPSCGVGGPNFQAPETEKLIACEPDLIVSEYGTLDAANLMEEATGADVFTLSYGPKNVFDEKSQSSLLNLAKLLKRDSVGESLVSYIKECETDISDRTKDINVHPKAYVGGIGNWGQTDIYTTHTAYPMFQVGHIDNAVAGKEFPGGSKQGAITKAEWIGLGEDLDILYLDAAGVKKTGGLYNEDNTIFDENKAIANGEVYLQMPFNAYYTNLEIALMDAYFDAAMAYPMHFADVDLTAKYDEILSRFLGKTGYASLAAMSGAYGGFQKIDDLEGWFAGL